MTASLAPPDTDAEVRRRLRRIEGQACGLRQMWEQGRPPEDLLDQIASVRAALAAVALSIVDAETTARLRAVESRAADAGDGSAGDVLSLVHRLLRCR